MGRIGREKAQKPERLDVESGKKESGIQSRPWMIEGETSKTRFDRLAFDPDSPEKLEQA